MKKIVLAALLLSPLPAFAADLAPQAVEPVVPVITPYSWTGFYIGAHAGYAWAREKDNLSSVPGPLTGVLTQLPLDNFDASGAIGGIHAGYNEQFDNNFVIGLEGDVDISGIHGSNRYIDADLGPSRLEMRNRWQGSIRARAGYAFDRFLIYATGGVAFADVRERWNLFNGTFVGSDTNTRVGWTAGGGVEYAFDDHWIGRAEVRYSDFGKSSFTVAPGTRFKAGFHETVGVVGVSYKF